MSAYNPQRSLTTVRDGLARLVSQFQSKPRTTAELTSYLQRFQELEDAAWQVILGRSLIAVTSPGGVTLTPAQGAQLDQLGKIVGVTRSGLGDSDYLIAIAAQIYVNRSSGIAPNYQHLLKVSSPAGATWSIAEYYPATMLVQITSSATWNVLVSWFYLRAVKALGVRLLFVWSPAVPLSQFKPYNASSAAPGPVTYGYDNAAVPGVVAAGKYASGFAV